MIWLLLLICIYGTIFCIEQLFNILGTHIGIVTVNQTVNILTKQTDTGQNNAVLLVRSLNKMIESRNKAQKVFTITSIVLSILWTLFFYLWN